MNDWTARPAIGVGLRVQHMAEVLARRPRDVWFEVHAENYMIGETAAAQHERAREFCRFVFARVGILSCADRALNASDCSDGIGGLIRQYSVGPPNN